MQRSVASRVRCHPARHLWASPLPLGASSRSIARLQIVQRRPLVGRARQHEQDGHYPQAYRDAHRPFNGPSRMKRVVRSLLWASLFSVIGIQAGLLYHHWLDLQLSSIVPDSDTDAALVADIMRQIDQSAMVRALRQDPSFVEVWPLSMSREEGEGFKDRSSADAAHHLLFHTMRGSRGVFPRAFYRESQSVLCMVVGFGTGTEDEQKMTHAGIVSTMIYESMAVLARAWFPPTTDCELVHLDMNFDDALPSQSICCIIVMPLNSAVKDLRQLTSANPGYTEWANFVDVLDFRQKANTLLACIVQSEGHPLADTEMHGYAAARFDATGPEWPPSSATQLDMDGTIT